jgi:outer membrane lipoprotein-sorting protein
LKKVISLGLFCLICFAAAAHAEGPSADEIIGKVDNIRNPAESYAMKVEIISSDTPKEVSVFDVAISGNNKTVVRALAPASNRGRNLLMLDEEMWAFIPNLNRAVRVSLSQKLNGQAANGDISRMRWHGDYDAKIESESDKAWTLFLSAKKKGLTYEKVRVWIDKSNFRPERAEYLSLAGKPLKKASFRAYRELAGKVRPGEILIEDAIRKDENSLIRVKEMTVKSFPESMFNQNNLK